MREWPLVSGKSSFMVFVGCKMGGRECHISVNSRAICRGNRGKREVFYWEGIQQMGIEGKVSILRILLITPPHSLPPVVTVCPANVANFCSSKKWYLMAEVRMPYITLSHLFHYYIIPSQVQIQQTASSGNSTFGVY